MDQRQARDYRADIDGLRALAVLPIVAFHLGFRIFDGGYVGVDIFFVISGYLIGGHVLKQVRERRYSVLDFYLRRFRRIVPALAVVLLATTVAAWFVLLPKAMADYGKSLAATALFGSNFYFWSSAGYFAAASETKPLLHTWSLAVEEQYYALFPLIIVAVRWMGERAIHVTVAALTLLSLAASVYGLDAYPTGTFYLLPTRIWELLLGVIAVAAPAHFLAKRLWREGMAWAGAALVVYSIFFYTPDTPFPGLAAVPPCLGTALLLAAGARGPSSVSRLLAFKPAVFFGLISYSLYLWHWPIIVLLKQALLVPELSRPLKIAAFLLSTALAWVSWRFVERPWRSPGITTRTIMVGSGLSAALLCLVGGLLAISGGAPGRYDSKVARIAELQDKPSTNDFRDGTCFLSATYSFADYSAERCLRRDPERPNVLLMGDSHAAHLWSGLQKRYPEIHFQQATASGCKAAVNRVDEGEPRCRQLMRFLFDTYLPSRPVDWVILSGRWNRYDAKDVADTVDWLRAKGYRVILAGPIVMYDVPLPQALALAEAWHDPGLVSRTRLADGAELDALYRALAQEHGALYFSPYAALCGDDTCRVTDRAGLPLQFDYGHLTAEGSYLVAGALPKPSGLGLPSGEKTPTH